MSPGKLSALLSEAARNKGSKTAGKGKKKNSGKDRQKATGLYSRLAALYAKMENAYDICAAEAGLSCRDCENNCCTSFFQHHTYVEWAYLWRGLHTLSEERRSTFIERAGSYMEKARQSLALGVLPSAMCPLNENGLCALYSHRLMICRLHGTRNVCTLPDGKQQVFPGCHRFTALPCAREAPPEQRQESGGQALCPSLDRTPFYKELAALEMEFHKKAGRPLPRVNLTLAEMIVLGPPRLR